MKVKLNRDYTTYNYVKKEDEALAQGTEFDISTFLITAYANVVTNANGEYVIPGAYLKTQAEEDSVS